LSLSRLIQTTLREKKDNTPRVVEQNKFRIGTIVFQQIRKYVRELVMEKLINGRVLAYIKVVEWQKRGLPHAHKLILIHQNDVPTTPEQIVGVIRAELPLDKETEPELYSEVTKHMLHTHCLTNPKDASCLQN
jgi:ATP-dependent DNA helicase PIF1